MKYLTYIFRNARRNPVRSLLTIASTAISLTLMMILVSFFTINNEVTSSSKEYNRIITMSSHGFAGKVPIARVNEIEGMDGVVAASPFSWYGGKYGEESNPFAQFGVNANTYFKIYNEYTIPADQLKAFQEDKAGCVIGRKLAEDRGLKIGNPFPLKGDIYPFDLNLTIRGIYDGPSNRDRRMAVFHWEYLDEGLKRSGALGGSGNAGIVVAKCKSGDVMASLSRKIDSQYLNSDTPTRTQTEEAFGKMFSEMMGDLKGMMRNIGMAVVFSLMCVAGNAMAMALRERTTEVAVLKAIGFGKQLVLFLVLAEAMIVTGIGGVLGTIGSKFFFDFYDIAKHSAGFLPFFYVPWTTALIGLVVSLLIGFASGIVPAYRASRLSVVNGLRKVV
ncbi:MAG: ABC transporter permease [Isosphaeraceae bacterium]